MLDELSLHSLENRLGTLLDHLVQEKVEHDTVRAEARTIIKSVEGKGPDNHLVRPGWESYYRSHRREGRIPLASGWFEETDCLDRRGVDVLFAVFEEAVRYVIDATTSDYEVEYAGELAKALGRYLSLRASSPVQANSARDRIGAGQGEGGGEAREHSAPIPADEANEIARNYIKEREKAGARVTARELQKHCSIALGRVSDLLAWRAYQARMKQARQGGKPRENRQLTRNMLAAIGQDNDPSEKAGMDNEEAAWLYLLDSAKTQEERGRLNTMTAAEKAEAIRLVMDQFADEDKRGKREND